MIKEAQQIERDLVETMTSSEKKFECMLDPELQSLARDLFDFKAMKTYMAELGLDVDKLPVGKLTHDKIKRGHQLLCEIQRILVTDETKKQHHIIVALTNDFYSAIPHNFGMVKPPVIDHLLRVKEKTRMLEQLADIVNLQQIYLKVLPFDLKHKNTYDCLFSELCTRLSLLDHASAEYKVVFDAVNNTQHQIHSNQISV